MQHEMNLQDRWFKMVKQGEKTVELRLYDKKRRKIKVGDEIIFTNGDRTKELTTQVTKIDTFKNFEELYKKIPPLAMGYAENELKNASYKDMEKYYSREQQDRFGVVAIEVRLI